MASSPVCLVKHFLMPVKLFSRNVHGYSFQSLDYRCLRLLRRSFAAVTCSSGENVRPVPSFHQCNGCPLQKRKHWSGTLALSREASTVSQPPYRTGPVSMLGGRVQQTLRLLEVHASTPSVLLRQKSGGKDSRLNEDSDEEELDDDDYEAPPNFKRKKIHLKSLRADSIISAGLDISRNRVDEIFYKSQLRLNGDKLLKKSKQIDEGDYVDMVMERSTEDAELMVKRVKVIRVSSERTSSDKREVTVKVWKKAFPVEDKTKPQY